MKVLYFVYFLFSSVCQDIKDLSVDRILHRVTTTKLMFFQTILKQNISVTRDGDRKTGLARVRESTNVKQHNSKIKFYVQS